MGHLNTRRYNVDCEKYIEVIYLIGGTFCFMVKVSVMYSVFISST